MPIERTILILDEGVHGRIEDLGEQKQALDVGVGLAVLPRADRLAAHVHARCQVVLRHSLRRALLAYALPDLHVPLRSLRFDAALTSPTMPRCAASYHQRFPTGAPAPPKPTVKSSLHSVYLRSLSTSIINVTGHPVTNHRCDTSEKEASSREDLLVKHR